MRVRSDHTLLKEASRDMGGGRYRGGRELVGHLESAAAATADPI